MYAFTLSSFAVRVREWGMGMITRLKLPNGDGKEWECRYPFLVISSMDQFVRSPARQQSALLAEAENAPLRVATNK